MHNKLWYKADWQDPQLDYSDVLLVPQPSTVNSRQNVHLEINYDFKKKNHIEYMMGLPIVASNLSTTGTIKMAAAMERNNMFCALHKFIPHEELFEWFKRPDLAQRNTIYSMGIGKNDLQKFERLQDQLPTSRKIRYVMIEVANGYIDNMSLFVEHIARYYPEVVLIAGTVCTKEGVHLLRDAGADIVRIGIGTGAVCTTRIKTGVGFPQFSSIIECRAAADSYNYKRPLIMADGGIQCPGDIVKAFGAGADFVMIGSLLAGHDECNHIKSGNNVFLYGMSSHKAQEFHYNETRDYRGSEGREVWIKAKGPVQPTLDDITSGIRSAMTYIGARRFHEIYEKAQFIRVNNQYNKMLEK